MNEGPKLYCYYIPPIDFWAGAFNAKDLLVSTWDDEGGESADDVLAIAKELAKLESAAQRGFRAIGWEGDIVDGPFFFALPDEGSFSIGYVLKQGNNGATFVASPHPMPWLEDLSLAHDGTEQPHVVTVEP